MHHKGIPTFHNNLNKKNENYTGVSRLCDELPSPLFKKNLSFLYLLSKKTGVTRKMPSCIARTRTSIS